MFFNRYCTTIPLMLKLTQINIDGTDIVQTNRLQNYRFKTDYKMKKK